jgi:hypothetical protein
MAKHRRSTRKNPSTTTWLLIGGGVAVVGAWIYLSQRNAVKLVPLPVFTDDCAANRAALDSYMQQMESNKGKCDPNKVANPPDECIFLMEALTLPSKWPTACGPFPVRMF